MTVFRCLICTSIYSVEDHEFIGSENVQNKHTKYSQILSSLSNSIYIKYIVYVSYTYINSTYYIIIYNYDA